MPSAGRQQRLGHRDVGGGEAELATPTVALDHDPPHLVRATEQLGGGGDVALGRAARGCGWTSRWCRARGAGGRGLEPDAEHLEAELGAHALQERDVAAATLAEVEVGADDDEAGVRGVGEHLAHEVLGRLLAAGLVEVQHVREVEVAGGVEQLELLLGRGEQAGRRLGPHHLGRVTVEGDAHRGEAAGVGELAHEAQHRVVPEVHAVVDADGDDRAGAVVERGRRARRGRRRCASLTPALLTTGAPRRRRGASAAPLAS